MSTDASFRKVSRYRRVGMTLVEVAVSTLIVGLMMVTSLKSVGGVYATWTAVADHQVGMLLADQLLAEIMQSEYEEPDSSVLFGLETSESSSTRANWDDVDDYVSWNSSPPLTRSGSVIPGMAGWTRVSTVQLASVADPMSIPASDEGLKLITVSVTAPGGGTTVRQALRSRWGMLEQQPLVDGAWITNVDAQLTTGNGNSTTSGASLPNAAEDY